MGTWPKWPKVTAPLPHGGNFKEDAAQNKHKSTKQGHSMHKTTMKDHITVLVVVGCLEAALALVLMGIAVVVPASDHAGTVGSRAL